MTQKAKSDSPPPAPAPEEAEKRRQPRFDSAQPLWREGQDAPQSLRAINMSGSGMFIVADEEAEVGQELRVSFRQDDEEIQLQLEVVWRGRPNAGGPEGMGARIVGFTAGQAVYERFVQHQLHHGQADAQPATTQPPLEKKSVPAQGEPDGE